MEYSDSHHAALLRALPSNNKFALARRDPMRHLDVHSLQRELMSDAAMEQRRESKRTTLDNSRARSPRVGGDRLERNRRDHVGERRGYTGSPDYLDRPRPTARKDYEYERPSPKFSKEKM
jgi:hypothetical protein